MESQLKNLLVVEVSTLVQQHEQNENENENDKIRPWVDLPSELLNLIFSSLHDPDHISFSSIRDQIRFCLTCKGWQRSVRCLLGVGQFPFLISLKPENGCPCTFFNPITNKEIQVFDDDMEFPEPELARISCSRFGWWLLYNGFSLFFYNPFIPGSTIELPFNRNPLLRYIDSMSFTAPPTSSDCIVYVHDLYNSDNKVVIYRWCYGEDHWTDYHIDCKLPFGQSSGNPIFYRGAFYQLNKCGRLGISDPKKGNEQHIWKDLSRPKPLKNITSPYTNTRKKRKQQQQHQITKENRIHTKNYMAECDGKLVMVHVKYKDVSQVHSVHVFELDWSRMEWVTVQSLGNKAMFICHTGSLLIKTNGGAENKIYFPAFVDTEVDGDEHATKKVGGFYCLENLKYNFPPAYWTTVINCSWMDTKFQL